jgi:hypothetical protein
MKNKEYKSYQELCQENDTRIINNIYKLVLGRDADSNGLTFFSGCLRSGMTPEMLMEQLRNSDEFKEMKNINVIGLMGMATFTDNQNQIKKELTAPICEMRSKW